MRRETRDQAIERATRIGAQATLWQMTAIDALEWRAPDARERWEDDKGQSRYTASLYHSEAPHGGYVVLEHDSNGQLTHYNVSYLDEWSSGIPAGAYDARHAATALTWARDTMVRLPA